MPRDLEEERDGAPLAAAGPPPGSFRLFAGDLMGSNAMQLQAQVDHFAGVKDLHPYAQILGLADLESCIKLEDAAFPEHQRCSREKFIYRLTVCSELCLGLFTPAGPDEEATQNAETAVTANSTDSAAPERKGVLLAHLIATKTTNPVVLDEDMMMPEGWSKEQAATQSLFEKNVGHQEIGRTIGIHSLAVLPQYQRRGLGKILLKSYIQRMTEADNADRISLLTYDRLVPYYENSFGFKNTGKSDATFGGETWNNMVLDFSEFREKMEVLEEEEGEEELEEWGVV